MATSARVGTPTEMTTSYAQLSELIRTKQATIGVIGLGYVGLPLVRAFTACGFRCLGFDVDQSKIDKLKAGESYIRHIDSAALAQLDRTAEAAQAVEVLLNTFPELTVERHLKNFRWKAPADIFHYREGLLKAGVPLSKLTLVEPASKRSA